jgi:hypothetical protein
LKAIVSLLSEHWLVRSEQRNVVLLRFPFNRQPFEGPPGDTTDTLTDHNVETPVRIGRLLE